MSNPLHLTVTNKYRRLMKRKHAGKQKDGQQLIRDRWEVYCNLVLVNWVISYEMVQYKKVTYLSLGAIIIIVQNTVCRISLLSGQLINELFTTKYCNSFF